MRNYTPLKIVTSIISIICSLTLTGYFAFLSTRPIYWFIPLSVYFLLEGFFLLISVTRKEPYKGMRVEGVFQVVTVLLMTSYLLAMILWDDFSDTMIYLPTFLVLGVVLFIKLVLALINYINIKIEYEPMLHAIRNNDLITVLYLTIIIVSSIINYKYPGNGLGLLQEKPMHAYIIFISVNAICMVLASLLALSTDIRSKTKEPLSAFGKAKHVFKWVGDNEVPMFFSFVFTFYLIFIALLNVKSSIFYIFVAVYYLIFIFIRLINYLWHRSIVKRCQGNVIKENRKSSFILLFNAFMYTITNDLLIVGAFFLMLDKANVGTNLNLLLFILIPFCFLRFIFAFHNSKHHNKGNNTYKLGLSYISLISAIFSLVEIIAIVTHLLPSSKMALRLIIIGTCLLLVKILIFILAFIFIINFFKSIIRNRRKKEKLLLKKQQEEEQLKENQEATT